MNRRIFVSYRRDDNPIAWGLLRDRLCAEFGAGNVFFDQQSIAPGDDWRQVIDAELARAQLVVMVCGRQWAGPLPAGGPHARRIDDPQDMVRYELARAGALGKRIEPFLIDAVGLPAADDLPPDLRHLHAANHRPYLPGESPLDQLDRWIAHLRREVHGRQRVGPYLVHALWMSWVAVSVVWLLIGTGGLDGLHDVHDRLVQTLMASRGSSESTSLPQIELVVIDRDEHRELFAERTPLDAEVMGLSLDALREAATLRQQCDPRRPVGLALELAPGDTQAGSPMHRQLAQALRRLSACRPVVLNCPQSVDGPDLSEGDRRWLERITAPAEPGEAPVRLASSAIDATLLRPGLSRSELGAVLGDLNHGLETAADRCACAWRPADRAACQLPDATGWRPDRNRVLAPNFHLRHTLVTALSRAERLMEAEIVLIGADFARHDRLPSPIPLDEYRRPLVPAQAHAWAAEAAATVPWSPRPWIHAGVDLLLATVVAATMMLLWRDVALHPHLYTRRVGAYAACVALVAGLPLAFAQAAASRPEWLPLAAPATFCLVAVGLRCGLAGYEVLIQRHDDWSPFALSSLWHAAMRHDRTGWSARLRLAWLATEASVGIWALLRLS